MHEDNFKIYINDQHTIHGRIWLPEDCSPKAILVIVHGMTEHSYRYKELAGVLTSEGIAVTGFDLPGHGKNLNHSNCAAFGPDGWKLALDDIRDFSAFLQDKYTNVPFYILGFSLGSFLLREYLNKYKYDFSGAIIAGTGYQPAVILSVMIAIVKSQIKSYGFDETTPLVKQLSFETYNSKFKPNQTDFDWLCSDEIELQKYIQDPLCADSISAGLFWQLLCAMKYTGSKQAYKNWNRKMPILLISGENDPVGDFGKGVHKTAKEMKKSGIIQVDLHLLSGARHDIFHESALGCSMQAADLIKTWIKHISIL